MLVDSARIILSSGMSAIIIFCFLFRRNRNAVKP